MITKNELISSLKTCDKQIRLHNDALHNFGRLNINMSYSDFSTAFNRLKDGYFKLIATALSDNSDQQDEIIELLNWFFNEYEMNKVELSYDTAEMFDLRTGDPLCYDIESLGKELWKYRNPGLEPWMLLPCYEPDCE